MYEAKNVEMPEFVLDPDAEEDWYRLRYGREMPGSPGAAVKSEAKQEPVEQAEEAKQSPKSPTELDRLGDAVLSARLAEDEQAAQDAKEEMDADDGSGRDAPSAAQAPAQSESDASEKIMLTKQLTLQDLRGWHLQDVAHPRSAQEASCLPAWGELATVIDAPARGKAGRIRLWH